MKRRDFLGMGLLTAVYSALWGCIVEDEETAEPLPTCN